MCKEHALLLRFGSVLIKRNFAKTTSTMKDWSAQQYLKFEDDRNRPCNDLVSRIPLETPKTIIDIGCGPGNSTELLLNRYPNAKISGFDSSPDMIEKAKKRLPNVHFDQVDATKWLPEEPVDVLFSNAVFHWFPEHVEIMKKLFNKGLVSGGVLAIQMPDNCSEPSHELMKIAAEESPWAERLKGKQRARLPPVSTYYNALASDGLAASIDIWHTYYNVVVDNPEDIVEWVKGSGLIPFLHALDKDEQTQFLKIYTEKIAQAYPRAVDGKVLLRYPRIFIVAQRK